MLQADLLLGAADQLISDAARLRQRVIDDVLSPLGGASTAAGSPSSSGPHAPPASATPGSGSGTRVAAQAGAGGLGIGAAGERASPGGSNMPGGRSSVMIDIPLLEILFYCVRPDDSPTSFGYVLVVRGGGGGAAACRGGVEAWACLIRPVTGVAQGSFWMRMRRFARRFDALPASWVACIQPEHRNTQFARWARRLLPVASLSIVDGRAGAVLTPGDVVAMRARAGSICLHNTQLMHLSKDASTMPRFVIEETPDGQR